jgi:hypothetical protein
MAFAITDQDTIKAIQDAYNAQDLPLAYTLVFNAITTVTITEVPDGAPIVTQAPADGVDPPFGLGLEEQLTSTQTPAHLQSTFVTIPPSSISFGPAPHWIQHAYR